MIDITRETGFIFRHMDGQTEASYYYYYTIMRSKRVPSFLCM